MKSLTPEQIAEKGRHLQRLTEASEKMTEAIENFNSAMEEEWNRVEDAWVDYNEIRECAAQFVKSIASDAFVFHEEQDWKVAKEGLRYEKWVESLDNAADALEDDFEPRPPDAADIPEEIATALEELTDLKEHP